MNYRKTLIKKLFEAYRILLDDDKFCVTSLELLE
jgi:hypothetical protein